MTLGNGTGAQTGVMVVLVATRWAGFGRDDTIATIVWIRPVLSSPSFPSIADKQVTVCLEGRKGRERLSNVLRSGTNGASTGFPLSMRMMIRLNAMP